MEYICAVNVRITCARFEEVGAHRGGISTTARGPLKCPVVQKMQVTTNGCMSPVQTISSVKSDTPSFAEGYVSGVSFARTASIGSSDSTSSQPRGILMRHTKTEPRKKKTVVFDKRYSLSAENEESAPRKVSDVEILKEDKKRLEWEEERRSCLGSDDPFFDDDASTDCRSSQRTRSRGISSGDLDFGDDDEEEFVVGRRRTQTAPLEDLLGGDCNDDEQDDEAVEVLDSGTFACGRSSFSDDDDLPVRRLRSKTMCHDDLVAGLSSDDEDDCRGRARTKTFDVDLANMLEEDDDGQEEDTACIRTRSKTMGNDDLVDLLNDSDEEEFACRPSRARSKTVDMYGLGDDDDDVMFSSGGSMSTLSSKESHRLDEMAMGHVLSAGAPRGDGFSRPLWDIGQTAVICGEGEEAHFLDKADLLEQFESVHAAVEYLNSDEGYRELHEGICVVFSKSRRKYFLLYRTDQKAAALIIFNLTENLDDVKKLRA